MLHEVDRPCQAAGHQQEDAAASGGMGVGGRGEGRGGAAKGAGGGGDAHELGPVLSQTSLGAAGGSGEDGPLAQDANLHLSAWKGKGRNNVEICCAEIRLEQTI